jgi:hypothetical protein
MRRRISGDYENTWQRIPDHYIMNFGKTGYSIDDVTPNFYKFTGLNFKVRNDDGYFSDITEINSFFFGAETRFKTLIRIDGGYVDTDGSEYPTNATLYLGIMGEDIKTNQRSEITWNTKHISSVFEDFASSDIGGLGSTLTASEILTKIKNHTDGASNIIFQKYISGTAWNIDATTSYYNMATTGNLSNLSCWDLMKKMAVSENKVLYIGLDGSFNFVDKAVNTSTVSYKFHGIGDNVKEYGHNIKERINVDEGLRKVYNRVMVKFQDADTLSSYYIKKENWTWGDSSSSYLHGVRTLKYENKFIDDTATAQTVGDLLYSEYVDPKKEVKISAKFVPQVFLNDRVGLTYQTQVQEDANNLWGTWI